MKNQKDAFVNSFRNYLKKISDVQEAWMDQTASDLRLDCADSWKKLEIEYISTNDDMGYQVHSSNESYESILAPFADHMDADIYYQFMTRATVRRFLNDLAQFKESELKAAALAIQMWVELDNFREPTLTPNKAASFLGARRQRPEDALFKTIIQNQLKLALYERPKYLAIDLTDPDQFVRLQLEAFEKVVMLPCLEKTKSAKEIWFHIDGRESHKTVGSIETMISRLRNK